MVINWQYVKSPAMPRDFPFVTLLKSGWSRRSFSGMPIKKCLRVRYGELTVDRSRAWLARGGIFFSFQDYIGRWLIDLRRCSHRNTGDDVNKFSPSERAIISPVWRTPKATSKRGPEASSLHASENITGHDNRRIHLRHPSFWAILVLSFSSIIVPTPISPSSIRCSF